jgi:hypothetical protein
MNFHELGSRLCEYFLFSAENETDEQNITQITFVEEGLF